MDITITINCDSAAFEDCAGDEVARILRKVAERFDGDDSTASYGFSLKDINGNTVGRVDIQD